MEQILSPENNRYTFFPIKHDEIYKLYTKQVDSFWRAQEVDLSRDLKDWNILTEDEKHFISMVLAFF